MKKLVYVSAILTLLSLAYYFAIALPKKHNLEAQEKCAVAAKKFIDDHYSILVPRQHLTYESHYNSKLNKCFILVTDSIYLDDGVRTQVTRTTLTDVLSGRDYGGSTETTGEKPIYTTDKGFCSMVDWWKYKKKLMDE